MKGKLRCAMLWSAAFFLLLAGVGLILMGRSGIATLCQSSSYITLIISLLFLAAGCFFFLVSFVVFLYLIKNTISA